MKRIKEFATVQDAAGLGRWHGRGSGRPYSAIAYALSYALEWEISHPFRDCIEKITKSWTPIQLEQLRTSLIFALGETGLSVLEGIIPLLPRLVKYDVSVEFFHTFDHCRLV